MEVIRGKTSLELNASALVQHGLERRHVVIDLGTGDGRFVKHLAEKEPGVFVIGIDTCRENLRATSRLARANTLFVIANAQSLPRELYGLADRVTINFPWGSLLRGLLEADPGVLGGLCAISRPGALLEVRLNAAALAEMGCSLENGTGRVQDGLGAYGFGLRPPSPLDAQGLRACPTTWARRLAVGRDPRALAFHGMRAS